VVLIECGSSCRLTPCLIDPGPSRWLFLLSLAAVMQWLPGCSSSAGYIYQPLDESYLQDVMRVDEAAAEVAMSANPRSYFVDARSIRISEADRRVTLEVVVLGPDSGACVNVALSLRFLLIDSPEMYLAVRRPTSKQPVRFERTESYPPQDGLPDGVTVTPINPAPPFEGVRSMSTPVAYCVVKIPLRPARPIRHGVASVRLESDLFTDPAALQTSGAAGDGKRFIVGALNMSEWTLVPVF